MNQAVPGRVGHYLGGMWAYRHFWWSLFVKDLGARYRRSLLGIGW